jgi:serine/threonine protein kinase
MKSVDDIYSLYTFDKLLSETPFGKVYLGQDIKDMNSVIIKQSSK